MEMKVSKDIKRLTLKEKDSLILELISVIYMGLDDAEMILKEVKNGIWRLIEPNESCLLVFKDENKWEQHKYLLPCVNWKKRKKHCWEVEEAKRLFEKACNEKKIIRIPESPKDKRRWFIPKIRSKLIIPMFHKDKVIGLINLSGKRKNIFGRNDEIRLGHIAKHVAIAFGVKEEYNFKLKKLSSISDKLMENLDSLHLLDIMVEQTTKILNCELCSLFLVSEDKGYLELKRGYGYPRDKGEIFNETPRLRITDGLGTGLTGWVAATNETLKLNRKEIRKHPAWRGRERTERLEYLRSGKCFSLIGTPIKGKYGALLGVLKVENKLGPNGEPADKIEFTEDDKLLFQILAQKIGLCLEIVDTIKTKKELDEEIKLFWKSTYHNMKSPIHTVLLSFEQLEEERPELKYDELFQVLKQENYRFARYVKNLFYLARTEFGALKLIKTEFDIVELAEKLKSLFKRAFNIYNIDFKIESLIKEEEGFVYADKDAILDIMVNLMTNAINAIRQTERNKGNIRLTIALYNENFLKIEMTDDGIGIKRLDGLSQMIEDAKKRKKKLGLGLVISNKIIKEHKGKMWIEKNPKKEAIFSFTIPRRKI